METINQEIKKISVDGFEFDFNTNALDDVEVFEMLDLIEDGQIQKIATLLKILIGETVYKDIKTHFKEKYGVFRLEKMKEVYDKIFEESTPKG